MNILFVNACMRGENVSRTLKICRKFMEEYKILNPQDTITELDITHTDLKPVDAEYAEKRSELANSGKLDDPIFSLAHQFASADKIIIGAPYWDFSFPSALKVYIEHISVSQIAYHYTDKGHEGLCRAEKLLFITTSGGYLQDLDFGSDYLEGLCKLYGIPEFDSLKAEALDIFTTDVEACLNSAYENAKALAKKW